MVPPGSLPPPRFIRERRLDPDAWRIVGRGTNLQFLATDEDLAEILGSMPIEFEPYAFGEHLPGQGIVVRPMDEIPEVASFERKRSASPEVFSRLITGGQAFALARPNEWGAWARVNGFIGLWHGAVSSNGKRSTTIVSFAPRVLNVVTGVEFLHPDYSRIQQSVRDAIRRLCVLRSVTSLGAPAWKMTRRARIAHHSGTPYTFRPPD